MTRRSITLTGWGSGRSITWRVRATLPPVSVRPQSGQAHRGAGFLLRLWCLCQLLGEVGKLLFQGGILRLQLVDNMDGFFQGRWHGVSLPQVYPPKCEQLRYCCLLFAFGKVLYH
jgi:hypothetical protein